MLVVRKQVDHGDHDRDIDERIACSKDHLDDLEHGKDCKGELSSRRAYVRTLTRCVRSVAKDRSSKLEEST